jgi:hypothetical protein
MKKRALWGFAAIALMAVSASEGISQVPAGQNRIPQEVVINGQMVTAASVTTSSGQIQSFTCSSPQHYVTPDGASQGWACYEQRTGVWLLNAVPPIQAQTAPAPAPVPAPTPVPAPLPQQAPPPTVYQQQAPAYPQPAPAVIYQQPPAVIYQTSPVIYAQPVYYPQAVYPAQVIYQPSVIYAQPVRPVIYAPAYSPSVLLGAAAINAAGQIASAAIYSSHYPRVYYPVRGRWR